MYENYDPNTPLQDDPYAVDAGRIRQENEQKGGGSKTNWHQLPEGEATSMWRILPFPKRRSFFTKVTKHWNIPGMKGSVTCPRSFDDPDNPIKKLKCAICEKFFEMNKSSNPADQAFAKQALRSSTSYYVNALAVDKDGNIDLEKGIGVLNVPYGVWQTLYDSLTVPKFQQFSHPVRGRNIIITSSVVAGSQIPGKPGSSKRNYSVMFDDPSALPNMSVLEHLYDLDTVVGIPTLEFTQTCLERIITGDEKLSLPEGVPAWRGQLTAGSTTQAAPNVAPVSAYETAQASIPPTFVPPATVVSEAAPKFAEAAVTSSLGGSAPNDSQPTTVKGSDGKPICFTKAFDEENKTCLKCPEADACETAILKAKRAAAKASVAQSVAPQEVAPATPIAAEPSSSAVSTSEKDIRAMMQAVLNKK